MSTDPIRLESRSGLAATFVPQAGMIAISLEYGGQELLGQRGGLDSYVASGKTMGIPILYPWANRLARDSYEFAGKSVVLGSGTPRIRRDSNGLVIHGTLAAYPGWQVERVSPDDTGDGASLRATLDFGSEPELLASFPYPHQLTLEAVLRADTLSLSTIVTATGDLPVPLAFGFHPYIALPDSDRSQWTIDLPAMMLVEADDRGIPTGEFQPFDPGPRKLGTDDWDQGFCEVEEGSEFTVSSESWKAAVRFDSGYSASQVFAPAGEDLVCFEPMKAPSNALVTGRGLRSVEPGESDLSRFSITVVGGSPFEGETGSELRAGRGFLLASEEPGSEIRRVALEQVSSALAALRDHRPEERGEAVHQARKEMKKLRSLLRLVREELGLDTFRSENHRYRDASRLLSQQRDGDALFEAVDSLRDEYPSHAPPIDLLVRDLRAAGQDSSPGGADLLESGTSMEMAARRIEAGGDLIRGWKLGKDDWNLFEKGLRRTYRDGRRAMKKAESSRTPESVHEWRKRVKDLWYQLRLLRNAWRATMKTLAGEVGDLAELLGEHHDLAVLVEELERRIAGGSDYAALEEFALARQGELIGDALPLGHRIYSETPQDFVARIGSYWLS